MRNNLTMNPSLVRYIEDEVIPRYAAFDKAHREDHASTVIERALAMGFEGVASGPMVRSSYRAAMMCGGGENPPHGG